MTGGEEIGTNLRDGAAGACGGSAEAAYERLAGYAFARRLVGGRAVANVGREGLGSGSLLLAQTAESVEGFSDLPGAVESAALSHPGPNVSYRTAALPDLTLSDGSVGAVVALGVLGWMGRPEQLVREAARVLEEGGVLVASVPDRRINAASGGHGAASGGGGGMYEPEFRELLGRHFQHLRIYRQGAIAGGFVFPASGGLEGAEVEVQGARALATVRSADPPADPLTGPLLGAGAPTGRSVVAVCSNEPLGPDGGAYLLLDRDGGVFDESAERAEDVGLLREEIRQMQETEAQAFLDALRAQRRQNLADLQRHYLFLVRSVAAGNAAVLRGVLSHFRNAALEEAVHRRNIVRGNVDALKKKGVKGSARGALRRLNLIYQRLRLQIKGRG
jgi:SAM-dependent methyltransferase